VSLDFRQSQSGRIFPCSNVLFTGLTSAACFKNCQSLCLLIHSFLSTKVKLMTFRVFISYILSPLYNLTFYFVHLELSQTILPFFVLI